MNLQLWTLVNLAGPIITILIDLVNAMLIPTLMLGLVVLLATPVVFAEPAQQTIVVVRHGEKPPKGLGQLTCQGLQRSLRLPAWLGERFPPPDAIYAPNPSVKATEIHGDGQRYDYVRPLVTIAPTAISLEIGRAHV